MKYLQRIIIELNAFSGLVNDESGGENIQSDLIETKVTNTTQIYDSQLYNQPLKSIESQILTGITELFRSFLVASECASDWRLGFRE